MMKAFLIEMFLFSYIICIYTYTHNILSYQIEMEREKQEEQLPGGEMAGSEWHWQWVACKT